MKGQLGSWFMASFVGQGGSWVSGHLVSGPVNSGSLMFSLLYGLYGSKLLTVEKS